MKIKHLIATTVLGLAGLGLVETPALAATAGDLILGFQDTGSTGSDPNPSSNLEVDLGAYSNFTALEGTSDVINLTSGSNNASWLASTSGLNVNDLSASAAGTGYGANWNTLNGLSWTVEGYKAGTSGGVFVSNPLTTTLNNNGNGNTLIGGLINGFNSATLTADSNSTAGYLTTSDADSLTYQITNNGALPSGDDWNLGYNTQTGVLAANNYLYLWEIKSSNAGSTPGTLVGVFDLTNTGGLTFQATPEPSSYALLGLGCLVLFVLLRRRRDTLKA